MQVNEHAKRPSATKKGPGRYHWQGKGHKYVPRKPERSSMHPEVIAERRARQEALYHGSTQ